jgi:hypothetical protein
MGESHRYTTTSSVAKSEVKETLREKLIVAFVQTLVFGVLLALLAYWLNVRLETAKQALADRSEHLKQELTDRGEKLKALVSALAPISEQRRSAYLELRLAARQTKNDLEIYYFRAKGLSPQEARSQQIEQLRNKMGIGSGVGTSTWRSKEDAVKDAERLVALRANYEEIASDDVKAAVDQFLDTILTDLKDGEEKSNDSEAFHELAKRHLHDALDKLNRTTEKALGLQNVPIH